MTKITAALLAAILLLPFCNYAQDTVNNAVMQRIKEEETKHSQVAEIAHNLTDVCGPRLTNSPGYNKAVAWAVQQLKSWGLNAAPEAWGEFGKGWSTQQVYVALKQPYYQPLIAYPKAWTGSTAGLVTAKVVMLNKLDSAAIEALGDSIKGNIVMIKAGTKGIRSAFEAYATRYQDKELEKMPDTDMIARDLIDYFIKELAKEYAAQRMLEAKGAAALLTMNGTGRDGTLFVDGSTAYAKGYDMPLAQVVVSTEDYLRIQRMVQDKIPVQLEMNIKNQWFTDDTKGYNVVGEIPGTDPALKAQVVMLGGHLDSWHSGTGATDNAAGCIVMMEALRILKALGIEPRRTIRIGLWGGEEQGLLGSFGYVKNHFGNPADMKLTPEQKNISAYFNLDNGSGKIRGIYLQNNEAAGPVFKSWLKPFEALGATAITQSNTGSTDHLSFDAVGIPAFEFIQDPLEYETRTHHSNMDTYDHLQLEDLKQAAQVVAGFIYNAAMRDGMIPRKPLPKPERFVFDTDEPL
jgi:carboxypeptidase Q